MKLHQISRIFYKVSGILGDIHALKRGTYGKRVAKRATRKAVRSLFK
ncbi:hypothetical protein ACFOGI_04695 [Virgibacillus xinjiangensis]|uniref:Uncharacterized protein n=1 Tax=Virgibacillus xinjiangensis TaxID=393090 RepID=A0ABV7CTG5_9BACI